MACNAVIFKPYDQDGSFCVTKDNYSVYASLVAESAWGNSGAIDNRYWTMTLYRLSDGAYRYVDSRTGYVAADDPSHRTFDNIGQIGSKMKLAVVWDANNSNRGSSEIDFIR